VRIRRQFLSKATERYFYESFTDRDEFVRAVYDDVCARAMLTLNSSTTPRDAVERLVALMVDDPARGRGAAAGAGSATGAYPIGRRMDAQLHRPAAAQADPQHRPARQALVATGLIGALTARSPRTWTAG
jgi:hypothetical protein